MSGIATVWTEGNARIMNNKLIGICVKMKKKKKKKKKKEKKKVEIFMICLGRST